tara:strand:- start:47 stop:694 length:648 start_codon:yes stop_codon:yes gene_type:complete
VANNIQEQILAGDKTILDVFAEKSKDFDDMFPGGKNIFGQETAPLSQVELLEMIMPFAGSIRGGKQALKVAKGGWGFLTKYYDDLSKMKLVDPKKVAKIKPSQLDKNYKEVYDAFMKSHAKYPPKMQPRAKPPTGLKKELQDWLKRNVGNPSQFKQQSKFTTKYIEQRNKEAVESLKYDKAREALKTIQEKYKIADPDKAEFVDTISALLTSSRN